jgi:hypothetical protein
MVRAWHGRGIANVNQTRPHSVNQMGKTHSKTLAARHGRETAWARHAMCESALTFQQVEDSQISRQSAQEGDKAVSPMHRPVLISLRDPVETRAIDRIKSMKYSIEPNKERSRDLLACSEVPQPIAPLHKTRHIQHILLGSLSISDSPPTAQRHAK